MSQFINPFTDFGFKKLFGTEEAKPRLKSILEDALELDQPIESLNFMNAEQLGVKDDERKAVYDVYCTSADGSHFIVELQKAKQHFFKDRAVFYTSFPIRAQAKRGDWTYQLCPVYCLGILDFSFDDTDPLRWHHVVQLKDQDGKVFYDKLTYAFLEMKKFNKTPEECTSHLERWCYCLNNMDELASVPDFFADDAMILETFENAKIAALSHADQHQYEQSLKVYRDLTNVVNTAYDEGVSSSQHKVLEAEQKMKEAEERAEADRRQAEADRRQAEADRRQAEADRRQAEADRRQVKEEQQRVEEEKQRADKLKLELEELRRRLGEDG